jgi:hypothetical protein
MPGPMEPTGEVVHDPVVQIINNCFEESYHAKRTRMFLNASNFNCYHGKQDYSHKKAGQSKEFIGKVYLATEQITSFMQQAVSDETDWFQIEAEDGMPENLMKLKPEEMQKILERELKNNNINHLIPDAIKLGLLGSLMIVKVHGQYEVKEKFFSKSLSSTVGDGPESKLFKTKNDVWRLKLEIVRQEDWYPDPTGEGLYEMQVIEMDWYKLMDIAKRNPDIYDVQAVNDCGTMVQEEQKVKKSRETDQNATFSSYRRRIKIKEYWGDIIETGTGKVLHKNVVCAVANDHYLIRPPKPNPFWHGKSPFVSCPIIRVPHSVWHKALMDMPTKLNVATNELFNLMFDSGMMSTFGIKQVREQWLDDPTEIDDGVFPGQTLKVNSSCPPGMKVLEQVATGGTPQEAMNMYQLADRELQAMEMSSDIRNGMLPQREVKATEVVSSQNNINGMFKGITSNIETGFIEKILEKSWLTNAQYLNDVDHDDMIAMFGQERGRVISAMSAADRFADTVKGRKFKVFGMSSILNKVNDFRKLTSLMQTMGQTPVLVQEFAKVADFGKLTTQIIKSLDIDFDKIKKDTTGPGSQPEGPGNPNGQASPQALGQLAAGGGDQISQIPSMAGNSVQPDNQPGVQRGDPKMGLTTPGG